MKAWRGLEEFVAVAKAGSFTGAAKNLRVSSSHVSRAIASFEQRLGGPLFIRSTRQVRLTDIGQSLLPQCERLVQERNEIYAMASGSGEPRGHLRVTCSTSIGEKFIASILMKYADLYSNVSIDMYLTNRVLDIAGEGYDIAIRTGNMKDSRLLRTRVAVRNLVVCGSPNYLEKRGFPKSIEDLANHDCLVGTQPTWHFKDQNGERTWNVKGRWRANSGQALLDACLSGLGLSQLPYYYVANDVLTGRLKPVLEVYQKLAEPIWAVYPQQRHVLPKVSRFVELLGTDLQPAMDIVAVQNSKN
ncbi:DNA-binding transcriptional regulator, LysR family [Parasphingorhabdus marina DSM 22363]|uniref:DNA-binding transcriptional regulator, LysR family n=1 Tax=Parasphingorhabdus marina DSM 22363 TaxID=1123272 RepID=A0A1N6D9J8_9SPHN|nr:LysR family transcriptional regulator [Parasphingorhabdus marina]SIN67491.1 DNA-binding transcriptional regulator, LysR family [Parasphingorhabdus marina DSM 22363]